MSNSIKELMAIGQQGIAAHKSMMNIVSRNVANANTPGYARQRLNLVAVHDPGLSITTGKLETIRSSSLQRSILGASLSYGFHQGKTEVLELAEPALNDLDGSGVGAAMNGFFTSLHTMGNDPTGVAERLGFMHAAEHLGNTLRQSAEGIQSARLEAEFQAKAVVDEVNAIAKDIAKLNERITADAVGYPDPSPGLKNDRDLLLTRLSELVGINAIDKSDGTVAVALEVGGPLVDDTYANELKLTGGSIAALDVTIIKKDGGTMKPLAKPGGRLGGIMNARDVVLVQTSSQLDQMAFGFVNAVNSVHSSGFGLDGSTGNNLFEPIPTVAGAASNVRLSSDVAGDINKIAAAQDVTMLPGDNANILTMASLQDDATVVAGGKTVGSAYDNAVSILAVSHRDAVNQSDEQNRRVLQFKEMREQVSGVSLHEEMISLSAAERAFNASSQLVQTARDMYDTIFKLV